jgi:hypothetical protein
MDLERNDFSFFWLEKLNEWEKSVKPFFASGKGKKSYIANIVKKFISDPRIYQYKPPQIELIYSPCMMIFVTANHKIRFCTGIMRFLITNLNGISIFCPETLKEFVNYIDENNILENQVKRTKVK